jgi:hypothetical protein
VAEKALIFDVEVEHNDLKFLVKQGKYSPEDIHRMFKQAREKEKEEYRNSPEFKKDEEARLKKFEENQKKVDELTAQLDILDFSDIEAVLKWCIEFQGPSDMSGVKKDSERILDKFAKNGYDPEMYIKPGQRDGNKEEQARYIIKGALGCIQDLGAISPKIHGMYEKWKDDFNK